jgi:hypothetical protein
MTHQVLLFKIQKGKANWQMNNRYRRKYLVHQVLYKVFHSLAF